MPLQNRVAPDGSIHAVADRGLLTGNRGIIHDPQTRRLLKRRWTNKAWIACALEYQGRTRAVMSPGTWTELFFLDEVTALAAGHRPCFECRRARARDFAGRFAQANGLGLATAPQVDAVLHRQRLASGDLHRQVIDEPHDLPDGVMLSSGDRFFASRGGELLQWTFSGYRLAGSRIPLRLVLVTPPATVAAIRAGYRPQWHPSGDACRAP